MWLSHLVLAIHFLVIAFNVLGLVVIPLGAAMDWPFVRARLWRLLHLVSWGVVALQAAAGRACFLTEWQADLSSGERRGEPMIARLVNGLIYWPLPLWVFAGLYAAVFAAVIALFWIVPPRPVRR